MPKPHTLVVARKPEDAVVTVRVAMFDRTLKVLRVEAINRDVTVSDLIAEALAQRPVAPIAIEGVAEVALKKGSAR